MTDSLASAVMSKDEELSFLQLNLNVLYAPSTASIARDTAQPISVKQLFL